MRTRCRFGIHDWEHIGYDAMVDTSWDCDVTKSRAWQKCTECGKRRTSKWFTGTPPEVRIFTDERGREVFTDSSRKR